MARSTPIEKSDKVDARSNGSATGDAAHAPKFTPAGGRGPAPRRGQGIGADPRRPADRKAVRQGLGHEARRRTPEPDRGHPDRLALARHRPRRRRRPQGPRPRDLRPGILRQDDPLLSTSSPAARSSAAWRRSSTPSTRSTRRGPSGSASSSTTCWSRQPDTGEQALEICELLVRSNAVDVDRHRLGRRPDPAGGNRRRDGRQPRRPAGPADDARRCASSPAPSPRASAPSSSSTRSARRSA